MGREEQRLECLKLAIDYAKYKTENSRDKYYTESGIISLATDFYEFIS